MAIERIIGIDFGTSTSVIKVKTYRDGKPMDAADAVDYVRFGPHASVPTLVYLTEEGQLLVGWEAENAAVKGTLHQNFKLNLIDEDPTRRSSAGYFTQMFFDALYRAYAQQREHYPACDTETTWVSYPAKWPPEVRENMLEVARRAGFQNVQGLDEPSAAIHAVMVQQSERLRLGGDDCVHVLMVDMGAGTTDLVLCRYAPYNEPQITVLQTWPEANSTQLLGGSEIDSALCDYLQAFLEQCGLPSVKSFRTKHLNNCKKWKETNVSPQLAKPEGAVSYCGFVDAMLAMLDIEAEFPALTRARLEEMLPGYLAQYPQMVSGCLQAAGFAGADVDYVILTGGHSQWYFAQEILTGQLGRFGTPGLEKIQADPRRILRMPLPQETVAMGLVLQKVTVQKSQRPSLQRMAAMNILAERFYRRFQIDLFLHTDTRERLEKAAKEAVQALEQHAQTSVELADIARSSTGERIHLQDTLQQTEIAGYLAKYASRPCVNCGMFVPRTEKTCPGCGKHPDKLETPQQEAALCRCPACGKALPKNAAFCGYCGKTVSVSQNSAPQPSTPLQPTPSPVPPDVRPAPGPAPQKPAFFCGVCGQALLPDARFCPRCGKNLQQGPAAPSQPSSPASASSSANGRLLKELNGIGYYRGVVQLTGKLQVYEDKLVYIASKMNMLAGVGADHTVYLRNVTGVLRTSVLGINLCIKVYTPQKEYLYGFGVLHAADIDPVMAMIEQGRK